MGIEFRKYGVEVFAQNMLLHGRVSSARRLTDLVNQDEPYVDLDDVHIFAYVPDAMLGLETHQHGMINKASIVILTEVTNSKDTTDAERMGVRVAKDPHRLLIYVDQFAINADIHLAPGVDVPHLLGQPGNRFIPVTNATVTPTQPRTQLTSFRREFMLVNTAHIEYLGNAETTAEAEPTEGAEDLIG